MELTAEQKDVLLARYQIWGLDKVRAELDRPGREEFAHEEVTEFARAWVKETEARLRRRKIMGALLWCAGVILLGAAVGYYVKF